MSVYCVNQMKANKYLNVDVFKSRLHQALKIEFTMQLDLSFGLINGQKLLMIVDDLQLPLNNNAYLLGLVDYINMQIEQGYSID